MKSQINHWLPLVLCLWVSASRAEAIGLDEAVISALARDPALISMKHTTAALATMPDRIAALPDPVLSINAMNLPVDTFDLDQEPMSQLQVQLSQGVPYPGKRGLKKEIAELAVHTSSLQQAEYRGALIARVRTAWWDLLVAGKTLAIIRRNERLLSDFIEVAGAKYSVGNGLQQDVLLAQLELTRLQERAADAMGGYSRHEASLAGLIGRSPGGGITIDEESLDNTLPGLGPLSTLVSKAIESRKLIEVRRQQVRAAELQIDLAEKNRLPDFRFGLGYGLRQDGDMPAQDRPDFVSVMFSMNLPLYSKQKQDRLVEQRLAEHTRETALLDDALWNMRSDIGQLASDYLAAKEQVEITKMKIIPLAEQTVDSMLAGYQVNKVDFLNLINGQVMLYNARINYWHTLGRAKRALAMLAASVGEESLYE